MLFNTSVPLIHPFLGGRLFIRGLHWLHFSCALIVTHMKQSITVYVGATLLHPPASSSPCIILFSVNHPPRLSSPRSPVLSLQVCSPLSTINLTPHFPTHYHLWNHLMVIKLLSIGTWEVSLAVFPLALIHISTPSVGYCKQQKKSEPAGRKSYLKWLLSWLLPVSQGVWCTDLEL